MQLYHTQQTHIQSDTLIIQDPRLIHQLKRVMRARTGEQIMIQSDQSNGAIRYLCTITNIYEATIQTTIIQTTIHPYHQNHKHLIIAMSNKWDKMELIIQKAVECGISNISIIPMSRSMIRQCNNNKFVRLQSIALEAVEQSRSSQLPIIQWHDDWTSLTLSGQILVCNMDGQLMSDISKQSDITLIVGPEGGIDSRDITAIQSQGLNFTTISLGSTVLRMETAAIVGSWWICN